MKEIKLTQGMTTFVDDEDAVTNFPHDCKQYKII